MSANVIPQKQKFSVAITTDVYRKLINNTLQDPQRVQRFTSAISSAVAVNPALQECTPGTILSGALLGESLNLSPSPQLGQYYLVPFSCQLKDANGKNIWQTGPDGKPLKGENGRWIPVCEKRAQFVLGYKGYLQLAIRSGQYRDIDSFELREGEYLGKDSQTGQPKFQFVEDDDAREKLPVIGYVAYFEYLNGFRKVMYWSREKMMAHADQYSAAFSAEAYRRILNHEIPDNEMWKYSSYWYKDFDGMAKKTMLRQLISKWGIMSIDNPVSVQMQSALNNDNGFIRIDNGNFNSEPEPNNDGGQMPGQTASVVQGESVPPEAPAGQQVNLADL